MSKRSLLSLLATLFMLACGLSAFGQSNRAVPLKASGLQLLRFTDGVSEREQDGLNGPVRRVRTETAKLSNKNGKLVEGQRATLEVSAYDIKGAKIENAYYPIPGAAITGKEVYKYDDKGNIIEMTLQDDKGTLLSKETYTYEFDQFANWTKMTTSVAVIENGKITFEPTEVTYRTISYYLDEATLAKMSQPAQPAANTTAANNASTNSSASGNNSSTPTTTSAQPASNASPKPGAQTNASSNGSSTIANQPSQSAANNKTATSDASKQSPTQAAPSTTTAPVVKASAPAAGDKSTAPLKEQARDSSAGSKPAESKSVEEQATKPVVKPLLKPVSVGILNGKALNLPKPVYPLAAKNARVAGLVVIEVVIDINGKVISAKAVSGPLFLQQAAVQAAYQARFSPTMVSGQPVKAMGTINYNFVAD